MAEHNPTRAPSDHPASPDWKNSVHDDCNVNTPQPLASSTEGTARNSRVAPRPVRLPDALPGQSTPVADVNSSERASAEPRPFVDCSEHDPLGCDLCLRFTAEGEAALSDGFSQALCPSRVLGIDLYRKGHPKDALAADVLLLRERRDVFRVRQVPSAHDANRQHPLDPQLDAQATVEMRTDVISLLLAMCPTAVVDDALTSALPVSGPGSVLDGPIDLPQSAPSSTPLTPRMIVDALDDMESKLIDILAQWTCCT